MAGRFQDINYELDKLPPMPIVAAQMIELINSPETSANQLAKVISKDPAVSARVLKIANSSFYSMSRQVSTLSTAIVILGEGTLKNLVLAASMRGMNSNFGDNEKMLWEDSMVCALGSRFLARKLGLVDPEEAFMAGLFRHIGKIVINNQEGHHAALIKDMVTTDTGGLTQREKESFGASHDEIGAAVLEHWQLSELMSLVALHHFDVKLDGVADASIKKMICVVNVASHFPALFGIFGEPEESNLAELDGAIELDIDDDRMRELIEEFRTVFNENKEEFLS